MLSSLWRARTWQLLSKDCLEAMKNSITNLYQSSTSLTLRSVQCLRCHLVVEVVEAENHTTREKRSRQVKMSQTPLESKLKKPSSVKFNSHSRQVQHCRPRRTASTRSLTQHTRNKYRTSKVKTNSCIRLWPDSKTITRLPCTCTKSWACPLQKT